MLAFDGKSMRVMLVKRTQEPHIGRWVSHQPILLLAVLAACVLHATTTVSQTAHYMQSLPGTYVSLHERTEASLRRSLQEHGLSGKCRCAGSRMDSAPSLAHQCALFRDVATKRKPPLDLNLVQLSASHSLPRDNYAEVISVTYLAFTPLQLHKRPSYGLPSTVPIVLRDQDDVDWFELDDLPPLAFDHLDVLRNAWARCECAFDDEDEDVLVVRDKVSKQVLAKLHTRAQDNNKVDSTMVIKVPRLMIENGSL